jgi:predicted NAD/FAD-dependent oxidoreductase
MSEPVDVLIVGAGLAGIMAAITLRDAGKSVRLLERGRTPGGRMATRDRAAATFDYGAQFFTARDPAFVALVEEQWLDDLVYVWCNGFPTPTDPVGDDGHPRYAAGMGMRGFAHELSYQLDLHTQARVVTLARQADCWTVTLEGGATHTGRALLLTPPVPQSLALLRDSNLALPPETEAILAAIDYEPCLALLIQLAGESAVPEPGAIRPAGEPLHILVDNARKGISRRPGALTLHAGPVFSRTYYNAPEAEVIATLLEAAGPWLGSASRERVELHRWRYSQPIRVHLERILAVPELRLCFAGDAFGGPRIEGAALSGIAAAGWLAR